MINEQKLIFRKAVFIVVYRLNKETNNPEYILLKRRKHWIGWEFPKGGVDAGENLQETAKRECFEETGNKPIKIKKYNISGSYRYPKVLADRPNYIGQTYTLFSAKVKQDRVSFDRREHSGFVWLPFNQAIKKLTHKNQKKCLRIVNKILVK
jgi:DNA polymerase